MNFPDIAEEVQAVIRNVPDFPKPGIQFKDITPLFQNPVLFDKVVDCFTQHYKDRGISAIVGVESRGFLFGVPMALRMGLPFILARKAGKLPADTVSHSYDLEYGTATLELHKDSLSAEDKVVIVDDLLATGGTANATIQLVEKLGTKVEACAFLIELDFLNGRALLEKQAYQNPIGIDSLIHY